MILAYTQGRLRLEDRWKALQGQGVSRTPLESNAEVCGGADGIELTKWRGFTHGLQDFQLWVGGWVRTIGHSPSLEKNGLP